MRVVSLLAFLLFGLGTISLTVAGQEASPSAPAKGTPDIEECPYRTRPKIRTDLDQFKDGSDRQYIKPKRDPFEPLRAPLSKRNLDGFLEPFVRDREAYQPDTDAPRRRPRLAASATTGTGINGSGTWEITASTVLLSPADAVAMAAADIPTVAPADQYYIRYLSLYNYPKAIRADMARLVSLLINSLSRRGDITIPIVLGPDEATIRINLFDYKIDPAVWDAFGQLDPYFHQKIVQEVPTKTKEKKEVTKHGWYKTGRTFQNGQPEIVYGDYTVTEEVEVPGKGGTKEVVAGASWVKLEDLATLMKLTNSTAPILRADWFLVNASTSPNYYKFLGFKKENDFYELVGARVKGTDLIDAAIKIEKDLKATVIRSGSNGLCKPVAYNNRIIIRVPTLTGYLWITHDVNESIGAKNFINVLINEKFDATEEIGTLPNGLQCYILTDANDNLLDEADIKIAHDDLFLDRRVRNGRSCIVCHSTGIQPFVSTYQELVKQATTLDIYDHNIEKAQEVARDIRRKFGAPVAEYVKGDSLIYQRAVAATFAGLKTRDPTSAVMASDFNKTWTDYQDTDLNVTRAAWDTGLRPEAVKTLAKLKKDGRNNGVLLEFVSEPPVDVRRDHWEEAFADLMTVSVAVKVRP
jgi:hypothetical protein